MSDGLDRLVGRTFVDRYAIEAKLGDGAMGVVYRARHVKISRQFAIKILRPRLVADRKFVARFEREAELASRLSHPNVSAVVDMDRSDDGLYYYAMELAPGRPLAELLHGEPLDPARVIDLARQIASGLEHAHEAGVIHRDLKPDNVLVTDDGRACIVDFGLAIPSDTGAGNRLTTAGLVVGTPRYMSPEQARGEVLDHRSDLYALGLVLYEMLSGQTPFDGDGVTVANAHVSAEPPAICDRVPSARVDPLLERLALRLLEKNPALRPPSARRVRELLDLIETDREAAARELRIYPRTEMVAPLEVAPRRSREWLYGAAAAAVVALLAFVLVLVRDRGSDEAPTAPTVVDVRKDEAPIIKLAEPALAPHDDPAPTTPPIHMYAPVPVTIAPLTIPQRDLTAEEIALLYARIGRELSDLEQKKGANAAIDLWPRYRWIRINDAIANMEKRRQAAALLERLRSDIAKER